MGCRPAISRCQFEQNVNKGHYSGWGWGDVKYFFKYGQTLRRGGKSLYYPPFARAFVLSFRKRSSPRLPERK